MHGGKAVDKQVTFKGTEPTADLESRLDAVQAKLEAAAPGARFAKYVVEATPRGNAVGLAVALADGRSWVRQAEGSDWDRTFLEIERRIDHLAQGE